MYSLKEILAVLFKESTYKDYTHKLSRNQIVFCDISDKVYKFVCLLAILYSTEKILNTILAAIAAFLFLEALPEPDQFSFCAAEGTSPPWTWIGRPWAMVWYPPRPAWSQRL